MAVSSWRWSVMVVVVVVVVVLGSASEAESKEHAPAPGVDCSSLILNMADCLSFVSNDSTTEKPEGTCCSGLKTVLKTGPECLCEAFKSSAQLGVVLNVTKAKSLPQACKVSASSATDCALSLSPNGAPVAVSPSSPSAPAPEAGAVTASVLAPAPAPGGPSGSAAACLSFSVGSLFVGLVVASLSCF